MKPSHSLEYKLIKNLLKKKSLSMIQFKNIDKLNLYSIRYLSTVTSSINKTEPKLPTIQENTETLGKSQPLNNKITSSFSYYGSTVVNYIQEANLTQKLLNDVQKYLKKEPKQTSSEVIKPASTLNINPISLKDTPKSQSLIIPKKSSIQNQTNELTLEERTINLCDSIEKASSGLTKSRLISELFKLLYENSDDVRDVIYRKRKYIINTLLKDRENAYKKQDKLLYGNINQCLAILGYVDPGSVKHHGINILSLDGGGARGFVTIEILKNIEKLCGKQIYQIFDYICGTSTGAVLAALLGIYKLSLEEIERQYKIFLREIFQRNKAAGIGNLVMSYAYYDAKIWESMLQDAMGDTLVINSAKEQDSCKISMVSNVTTPNHMKIFLFRNYNHPTWAQSHYDGTCRHKVWQAVRASSAAPIYYEDFKLDGYVFHDGGLLANNPTAIALHEVKHLWPSVANNCIVSIGNGRYKPAGFLTTKAESISLKQKINRIVGGISCTETVHTMLLDLLPTKLYFRFNPYLSEELSLDENRSSKWRLMQYETNMYMRRNKYKFEMCAKRLLKPKTSIQQIGDILKEKYLSPV